MQRNSKLGFVLHGIITVLLSQREIGLRIVYFKRRQT